MFTWILAAALALGGGWHTFTDCAGSDPILRTDTSPVGEGNFEAEWGDELLSFQRGVGDLSNEPQRLRQIFTAQMRAHVWSVTRQRGHRTVNMRKGFWPCCALGIYPFDFLDPGGACSRITHFQHKAIWRVNFGVIRKEGVSYPDKGALPRYVRSQGSSGVIGSIDRLPPSAPNQVDANAAQRDADNSHPAHYRSPERHGFLGAQVVLVALGFACGVFYWLRAMRASLTGQVGTFGRDIFLGVFGIVSSVAAGIILNFSLG